MPNYYDQHMHSAFSADSSTPASVQAAEAAKQKLAGICFTEHLDPDFPVYPDEPCDFTIDFPSYIKEISRLQEVYAGQLSIGLGMEFGIQSHLADTLHQTASAYPFDLIILSSHILHQMDPYYPEYFHGRSESECYREFLNAQYDNLLLVNPDDFDILGHLDYIVRYGPNKNRYYHYKDYADIIDPILTYLIRHDKCLEVNTGGLKYKLGDTNPSTDVLKRYHELGGRLITLGSDAHVPEYIAYQFEQTAQHLKTIGFETYTVFRGRKGMQMPL